jgi:hypothetical protein
MKRKKGIITNYVRSKSEQNRINRFSAERMHIEFSFEKNDTDNIINRE